MSELSKINNNYQEERDWLSEDLTSAREEISEMEKKVKELEQELMFSKQEQFKYSMEVSVAIIISILYVPVATL